jgi:excisionase family DNA binding protein
MLVQASRSNNALAMPELNKNKRWLRIEAAAEYARATPGFIKAHIRNGKLPFAKAGKRYFIDRIDLDAFLDTLRQTKVPITLVAVRPIIIQPPQHDVEHDPVTEQTDRE